jgi:hypothetical protein
MRVTVIAPILLAGMAAAASPAATGPHVGEQALPPPVQAAIEKSRNSCLDGEEFSTDASFMVRRDINGDGVKDFLLHYEHARCGDFSTVFCGTGGCNIQVFASAHGEYVKVLDHHALRVRFARVNGRRAMIQLLHGSHCGRVGADTCRSITTGMARILVGPSQSAELAPGLEGAVPSGPCGELVDLGKHHARIRARGP